MVHKPDMCTFPSIAVTFIAVTLAYPICPCQWNLKHCHLAPIVSHSGSIRFGLIISPLPPPPLRACARHLAQSGTVMLCIVDLLNHLCLTQNHYLMEHFQVFFLYEKDNKIYLQLSWVNQQTEIGHSYITQYKRTTTCAIANIILQTRINESTIANGHSYLRHWYLPTNVQVAPMSSCISNSTTIFYTYSRLSSIMLPITYLNFSDLINQK